MNLCFILVSLPKSWCFWSIFFTFVKYYSRWSTRSDICFFMNRLPIPFVVKSKRFLVFIWFVTWLAAGLAGSFVGVMSGVAKGLSIRLILRTFFSDHFSFFWMVRLKSLLMVTTSMSSSAGTSASSSTKLPLWLLGFVILSDSDCTSTDYQLWCSSCTGFTSSYKLAFLPPSYCEPDPPNPSSANVFCIQLPPFLCLEPALGSTILGFTVLPYSSVASRCSSSSYSSMVTTTRRRSISLNP